jgi:hypothetical protein
MRQLCATSSVGELAPLSFGISSPHVISQVFHVFNDRDGSSGSYTREPRILPTHTSKDCREAPRNPHDKRRTSRRSRSMSNATAVSPTLDCSGVEWVGDDAPAAVEVVIPDPPPALATIVRDERAGHVDGL